MASISSEIERAHTCPVSFLTPLSLWPELGLFFSFGRQHPKDAVIKDAVKGGKCSHLSSGVHSCGREQHLDRVLHQRRCGDHFC